MIIVCLKDKKHFFLISKKIIRPVCQTCLKKLFVFLGKKHTNFQPFLIPRKWYIIHEFLLLSHQYSAALNFNKLIKAKSFLMFDSISGSIEQLNRKVVFLHGGNGNEMSTRRQIYSLYVVLIHVFLPLEQLIYFIPQHHWNS